MYLIYAINRVIQVRAGAIESNIKTFLHKLQEHKRKEPANGIIQNEPIAQDVSGENAFVDDNRQVAPALPTEKDNVTHSMPMELDQTSMNPENDNITIPADDLSNIQVEII